MDVRFIKTVKLQRSVSFTKTISEMDGTSVIWNFILVNVVHNRRKNRSTAIDRLKVFDSNNSMVVVIFKWCNYVKVHKTHIIRHLKREQEHTAIDSNFNRNIEKVAFIPDLRSISCCISSLSFSLSFYRSFVLEH